MPLRQRPESDYVEIGIAWLAAGLLCLFVFPVVDDWRSDLGPLVVCLYGAAVLLAIGFAICKTASRTKREEPRREIIHPY